MLCYLTPHEDLLKPVKEVEGTSHADDEKYVYRYVPLYSLLSTNTERDKLYMKRLDKWNDPFERKALTANYYCKGQKHAFHHPFANNVYGICFTENYNCEAQWYYYGQKEPIVLISVKLEKLLDALDKSEEKFYIGRVDYCVQSEIQKKIAQCVLAGLETFQKDRSTDFTSDECKTLLRPLFFKRLPFVYEREIRILKVGNSAENDKDVENILLKENFRNLIGKVTNSPFVPEKFDNTQKSQKELLLKEGFAKQQINISQLHTDQKPSNIYLENYRTKNI